MRKILALSTVALFAGFTSPAYAQGAAAGAATGSSLQWLFITAGFALAIAAAFGALAQGKAVSSAVEGMARNPGASGEIRGALILGLVLIESLVIYALVVSLILLFVKSPLLGA